MGTEMRIASVVCLSAAALVSLETSAHAYLDPGTGSDILQALIAGSRRLALRRESLLVQYLRDFLGIGRQNSEISEDELQGEK